MNNRIKKNIIKGIISVVSISLIGCIVSLFACQPLFNIVKANFVQIVVNGQPKDVVREKISGEVENDAKITDQSFLRTQYGVLSCKSIGLNVSLYFGDTKENLYYGACIYAGGSVPGKSGTTLISAHNITYFKPLEKIKEKDIITIETMDNVFKYEVQSIDITKDYEDFKIEKTGKENLILYTCYPFRVSGEKTNQRFFVYCSLMNEELGGD